MFKVTPATDSQCVSPHQLGAVKVEEHWQSFELRTAGGATDPQLLRIPDKSYRDVAHLQGDSSVSYRSCVLHAGPDAAVVVKGSSLSCFLDGNLASEHEAFVLHIESYRDKLVDFAAANMKTDEGSLVLVGRWSCSKVGDPDRFEVYIVHSIGWTHVRTWQYDHLVFDGDGRKLGKDNSVAPDPLDPEAADEYLDPFSDLIVVLLNRASVPQKIPAFDGIIWFPNYGRQMNSCAIFRTLVSEQAQSGVLVGDLRG